ncbi:hypothetical protein Emag_006129 [Eimeria magna]
MQLACFCGCSGALAPTVPSSGRTRIDGCRSSMRASRLWRRGSGSSYALAMPLLLCLAVLSFSFGSADFLEATERQQELRQHRFAQPTSPASEQAKYKLAASLGLAHREEDSWAREESESRTSGDDPAAAYANVLEKLESIVRQEDNGRGWLHIALDPSSSSHEVESEVHRGGPVNAFAGAPPSQGEEDGILSALQMSIRESEPLMTGAQLYSSNEAAADAGADATSGTVHSASTSQAPDRDDQLLRKAVTDFQVIEEENALDTDSLVTIVYNFPLQTEESRQIAFIVMALPPGYTAQKGGPVCSSVDAEMPELTCTMRRAYMKNRPGSLSTFITVSSADNKTNLPLGRHSFRVAVRTPDESLSVDNPANWWFATFRFTGGHAITKHWENRKLISKQKCIWGQWRQETPCSTTCGSGFEVWTRTLYSGDSEAACGGAFLKRKCKVQECSLSCQLDAWETLADCTKSCGATANQAFKIRIRKVLLHKVGWGRACADLYPWDYDLGMGWSDKLQAVVSISPCDEKFTAPCPATLGCRVEESNTRTIPDAFPWGACPFPCGGFGTITSVVQVANGIPRWIGEKQFPESFQIPCKADKEPLVTTRKCNVAACEDCSVYIENPIFGRATRAWIFFIPTAEADIAEVTAPRGVSIVPPDANTAQGKNTQTQTTRYKVSALSDVLPPALHAAPDQPQLTAPKTAEDVLLLTDELGTCAQMATSFGEVESCQVFPSKHYGGSQAAELVLKSLIEPSVGRVTSSSTSSSSTSSSSSSSKSSSRPQWFALPVLLGKREEMEDAGNFYLWLTRSKYPNDPEVFKCHLKTKLPIPRRCKFAYRPKNPRDCERCTVGGGLQIETYRQFIPGENGGTCDVPHAMQQASETLVLTSCLKGCSQLEQRSSGGGKRMSRKAAAAAAAAHTARDSNKGPSYLERIGRREMATFVKGKVALHAAALAGDKFALASPEFYFGAAVKPSDEEAMPTIKEEVG